MKIFQSSLLIKTVCLLGPEQRSKRVLYGINFVEIVRMQMRSRAILMGGLLLAIYLNLPAPEPTKELQDWVRAGKYFNHNGQKIFYKEERGRRTDGPVLLLLHGFPTDSYDWIKVLPALTEKFSRVIMYDFIGFGFSDKPSSYEYSIMDQADIGEKLLDALGVKEMHILAHDYGDTVAQELLARFEERKKQNVERLEILSVCLLNGGMFPETNFPRITQKALLLPYIGGMIARIGNFFTFKKSLSDVFGPQTQPSGEDLADWWAAMRYSDGNLVLHKLIMYIPERRANRDRWVGALQTATIPLHVIYGPADPVNPPGFVDYYKKIIPSPSISVLDEHIGHYPHWEDPRFTMRHYFDFVTKRLPYKTSKEKDTK